MSILAIHKTKLLKIDQQVIRESFAPVTSKYIPDVMIHDLMKQFSSNQAYRLFDDVTPFFNFLKTMEANHRILDPQPDWPWQSTTVGIITNSDPRVPTILESLGLSVKRVTEPNEGVKEIDFVTMSYFVGVEKPDAQIFQAARTAFFQLPSSFDISPADLVTVHVGDNLEKDVFGAMDAGWYSIFLDRKGKFRNKEEGAEEKNPTLSVITEGRKIDAIKDLGEIRLWEPSIDICSDFRE